MKYDPKTAFGNPELIARIKARNKAAKKGQPLCDRCDRTKKACICP